MSAILSLPAELGGLVLKFAVSKYIEGAGAAAGAMTALAAALKALATEISAVASGTMTLAQLQAATAAQLAEKKVPVSTQILVNGLVSVLGTVFPVGPAGGLVSAALAGDVNLFAQDVIATATLYGA